MKQPRITVCVATKNRLDMLHQFLWSLIRQDYQAWDLVVVDDNDLPVDWGNYGVYPRLLGEIQLRGHQFKIVQGPRASKIGLAYQFGFINRFPESPLFFRADDDSWLEPDYFNQMVPEMKDGVAAIAGLFLHPGQPIDRLEPDDPRLCHAKMEHLSDATNVQWFQHKSPEMIPVDLLMGNILFNTERLNAIGGFDQRYNLHRDETQCGWRLQVEGGSLFVHPRAIAWHLRGVNGGARNGHPEIYLNDHRFFMQQRKTMKPGLRIDLGNALGDGLMYTPMLHEMRKQNPGRNISVWAHWGPMLLKDNPDVDEVCADPTLGHRTQFIAGGVYEWATQNQWKGHFIEAACKMFALPAPTEKAPRIFLDNDPVVEDIPQEPYVVIAPWSTAKTFDVFSNSGNKDWEAERWVAVVAEMVNAGYWVVQIRATKEEPEIVGVNDCWTGRPLREVMSLIKSSTLVISVDTFAHHAATGLDVPNVVLWGRSLPDHFGYDRDNVVNLVVECPGILGDQVVKIEGQEQPQCVKVIQGRPCIAGNQWNMDQVKCPLPGHPCMNHKPEAVVEAALKLLGK
jgi:ADP-heptose:LPS heptosyltransferase/GT2 family glycosyltransferase